MNTYKIIPVLMILLLTIGIGSCSKSFTDASPKGLIDQDQYYQNPDQAFSALVAAYASLNMELNNTFTNLGTPNSAGDDCYAGGGGPTDMYQWQVLVNFNLLKPGDSNTDPDEWNLFFQGVKDCNLLLGQLEKGIPGLSAGLTKRYIAECKFLRAHYYFDLVRWYGNVPLFNESLPFADVPNVTNASPEDVYSQIKKDLLTAIPDLPQTVTGSELGRAYVGAAEALLGKVLLEQASLHKNGVVLTQNSTLAIQEYDSAVVYLSDVNGDGLGVNSANKFGYKLQANYGNIFIPTNKFNSESIFEIEKGPDQDWSKTNIMSMMCGPRNFNDNNGACPDAYNSSSTYGWSFNTITPDLHDFMATSNNGSYDPRYSTTIHNIDSLVALGLCSYDAGYMNTGYFIGKYAPLNKYMSTVTNNFGYDYIEIRLADTYLMEAEAQLLGSQNNITRAALLINSVRERVGLPALTPAQITLSAIQNERRAELATEGHRYFDLVRWGIAAQTLNGMKQGPANFNGKHYSTPKNYLLPIPLKDLTNTKMKQNPGY